MRTEELYAQKKEERSTMNQLLLQTQRLCNTQRAALECSAFQDNPREFRVPEIAYPQFPNAALFTKFDGYFRKRFWKSIVHTRNCCETWKRIETRTAELSNNTCPSVPWREPFAENFFRWNVKFKIISAWNSGWVPEQQKWWPLQVTEKTQRKHQTGDYCKNWLMSAHCVARQGIDSLVQKLATLPEPEWQKNTTCKKSERKGTGQNERSKWAREVPMLCEFKCWKPPASQNRRSSKLGFSTARWTQIKVQTCQNVSEQLSNEWDSSLCEYESEPELSSLTVATVWTVTTAGRVVREKVTSSMNVVFLVLVHHLHGTAGWPQDFSPRRIPQV